MGDLDRRKHDVDIIERVLGGILDSDPPEGQTRVFDVHVPSAGDSLDRTLELTVDIDDSVSDSRRRDHKA